MDDQTKTLCGWAAAQLHNQWYNVLKDKDASAVEIATQSRNIDRLLIMFPVEVGFAYKQLNQRVIDEL